jgi:uridylate kinase
VPKNHDADNSDDRFVVKISGKALEGDGTSGIISGSTIRELAQTLKKMVTIGIHVVVVVGGGNIARGEELQKEGISRNVGDAAGMLATVENAFFLEDILEQEGQPARTMTAIEIKPFAELYVRKRALRHNEKGRVVIIGGGIGKPYHSTDFAAGQYAAELDATRVIMAKNGVDAAYTHDPHRFPDDAQRIDEISCDDFVTQRLGVCDIPAVAFCGKHSVEIQIVGVDRPMNIFDAAMGVSIGTLIHS